MNTNLSIFVVFITLTFSCNDKETILPQTDCDTEIVLNISGTWADDPYNINEVFLTEDGQLNMNISHSGGCAEHEYQLLQDPSFCGTPPIYISMKLSHNANLDPCEAWINRDLCFDISTIYEGYEADQVTIGLYNIHQTDTTWVFE